MRGDIRRVSFEEEPTVRPHIICHMCTSIDGRILGERWGKLPGVKGSGELFETTAASFGIGAWMVGTTTMKEFAGRNVPLKKAAAPVERVDFIADRKAKRFGIGADAKGVLRYQSGNVNGDHVVLLVTQQVSDDYLAHLRAAGVSYLFCGQDHVDLRVACGKIGTRLGLRKLLLEGGGTFNGAMLKAGLVDEISHVIVPVVDGSAGIPSLFEIPGRAPRKAAATLRLLRQRKLPGGVNWLHYRVIGKPA
jgi:2,5-diamino-6-(ribosylamino)-4(3H)-pyrimidinone 5'-phosphate reductase